MTVYVNLEYALREPDSHYYLIPCPDVPVAYKDNSLHRDLHTNLRDPSAFAASSCM